MRTYWHLLSGHSRIPSKILFLIFSSLCEFDVEPVTTCGYEGINHIGSKIATDYEGDNPIEFPHLVCKVGETDVIQVNRLDFDFSFAVPKQAKNGLIVSFHFELI
ncbi:hypothetical protein [Xylanibacter rodentium]|uniref:hypothetical protein n=1 Tax=Xylanibacter rodentium TaxID=2736289 RepID=UPI00259B7F03|nr:hypothetical protein [Xylanibacter rodentium]